MMTTMAQADNTLSIVELGRHVDRTTRRTTGARSDCTVTDLARGWCRLAPGDEGEFASSGRNRVHWLGVASPLTRADVDEMRAAVHRAGATGAFLWVSPVGLGAGGADELARVGAQRVPHVRYVSLVRRAEAITPARPSTLHVRRIDPGDVRRSMESVKAGGTAAGIAAAETIVANGWAELYGAFDAGTCGASAALVMDPVESGFLYLGWAGTDPAYRGRGAQSALIAARVSRAAELGAAWCVSETNTAAEGSLRNLLRAGFGVAVEWGVYRWRMAGENAITR
jgi:ribosomal protein S18 acetylase RimI-like enzyme